MEAKEHPSPENAVAYPFHWKSFFTLNILLSSGKVPGIEMLLASPAVALPTPAHSATDHVSILSGRTNAVAFARPDFSTNSILNHNEAASRQIFSGAGGAGGAGGS